jgi:hypothetical protein
MTTAAPIFVKSHAVMPLPGIGKGPSFNGEASELTEFLELFEDLAKSHGLPDDERCKYLVRYVDIQTKRVWVMLPGFATNNYDLLRKSIIAEYPGAEKGTRFTIRDLDRIVRSYRDSDISTEVELMQYARQFRAVAFWLVDNNELTVRERDRYFWYGLPQAARTAIDRRLEVRDPAYSRREAPDFHKAIEAGRFVFSDEALDVNRMGNHLLNHPNPVRQPPPAAPPLSRPHAAHQPLDFDGIHDRYGRDAPREVETRTVPFAPPAPTTQKPMTDDVEELVRKMYSLDVADVSYACCYTRLIGLMPAAAQVWTAPRMPHQPPPVPSSLPPASNHFSSTSSNATCYFCGLDHLIRNCPTAIEYIRAGRVIRENNYFLFPDHARIR